MAKQSLLVIVYLFENKIRKINIPATTQTVRISRRKQQPLPLVTAAARLFVAECEWAHAQKEDAGFPMFGFIEAFCATWFPQAKSSPPAIILRLPEAEKPQLPKFHRPTKRRRFFPFATQLF